MRREREKALCKVMTEQFPVSSHIFILSDCELAGEQPFFCLLCMSIVPDINEHLLNSQCFCNTDNMQS